MIEFTYKLIARGWAEVFFASDDSEVLLSVSFLSDALKDLLVAISVLHEGAITSECKFQDEPGEYHLHFSVSEDMLNLKIIYFDCNFNRKSLKEGNLIFQGSDKLLRFSRKIISQVELILNEHTMNGYKIIWGNHDFPVHEHNRT